MLTFQAMSQAPTETWPVKKQRFEVVLLKKGVAETGATPEDFKRIPVEAEGTAAAMFSDEVDKACGEAPGWQRLFAAMPGAMTPVEVQARARVHNTASIDRSKI